MVYGIEVVLKHTNQAVAEQVVHNGNESAAWTEEDVRVVLTQMLQTIDRVKNPGSVARPVTLHGFSWIVEPSEGQVVIAIEISAGAAVAGPFAIDQRQLDALITRVLASPPPQRRFLH